MSEKLKYFPVKKIITAITAAIRLIIKFLMNGLIAFFITGVLFVFSGYKDPNCFSLIFYIVLGLYLLMTQVVSLHLKVAECIYKSELTTLLLRIRQQQEKSDKSDRADE